MAHTVSLKWWEWKEQYKPVYYNPIANINERILPPSEEQLVFIKSQDPRYVWTWVVGDVCDTVVNGLANKSVGHYYICENPWDESNNYEIVVSVKVECACYDEDGYDTGNYGYEKCEECEGTGYHKEWIED